MNGDALVLAQFAQRRGKIGLGRRRVEILTGGQGASLRPRQRHAQHQQGAKRRNFMERWRDWLRQTLTFSTSAARRTSSDGTSPVCHAGEATSPSAVHLWRPFFNPVLTAKLMLNPYNKQGSRPLSRYSRWNSPIATLAKSCSARSAMKDRRSLRRRGSPLSGVELPVPPWLPCSRGPASVPCAASIAITWRPANC